jgi:DNA-binding MarR family transcriptional regulator
MTGRGHLYDLIKESFLLLDFGDRGLFDQFGLSISRYYALHHIAADPGLSPSRLSQLMFCDKSNITRLLQGLASDGYVERRPHDRDGRVQRLYLTERGCRLHNEACAAHLYLIERRFAALPEPAGAQLATMLTDLNRTLADSLSAG